MFLYERTPSGRSMFATFCKPQMNQLVKNIEFYKKEYNVYPDSLEQLTRDDIYLFINDPIQVYSRNKYGDKYIYRKVGSKYILFSMGVDGILIPKTTFLPSSKYFDSTLTRSDTT